MKFEQTPLKDAWIIRLDRVTDERGFFARAFCRREFEARGIEAKVAQCNISYNPAAGTLRGLHMQREPAQETKLVRCVRGALYDVIVDLRPDSATYLGHFGIELNHDNGAMLFVPRGFAHGFLTLKDETEAFYMVSEFYSPDCENGLRYNDPALQIEWPAPVKIISEKDAAWPLLNEG